MVRILARAHGAAKARFSHEASAKDRIDCRACQRGRASPGALHIGNGSPNWDLLPTDTRSSYALSVDSVNRFFIWSAFLGKMWSRKAGGCGVYRLVPESTTG